MFLWPIEFLVYVFSSDNIKVGDRLIGTDVYQVPLEADNESVPINKTHPLQAFGIVCAIVMMFCILILVSLNWAVNHPSHQVAVEFLEESPFVREHVGDIERIGFAGVSISTHGRYGWATHGFIITGSEGILHVNVDLERVSGQDWEVITQ
jgi:hypothetical protein